MNKISQWFDRTCGSWTSERRYIFNVEDPRPTNFAVNFTIAPGEDSNQYIVQWQGKTSGTMDLLLEGNTLHRSRDYFGDEAHSSQVDTIDEDTVVMTTTYGGVTYREEIRLLHSDNYRLRQTIGFNAEGKAALVGQYFERRV
jgi:hypothetical protein